MIDNDLSGTEWYRTYLNNNAENDRQARVMYETIQLFINCFIAITAAIAVANVFNTLTSSIILRRREFATLKSMGMEDRAFWRMIALECASYAPARAHHWPRARRRGDVHGLPGDEP